MRKILIRCFCLALTLFASAVAVAFGDLRTLDPQDRSGRWSYGFAYILDQVVYQGEENISTDLLPVFTYTGKKYFLDSTNFGWHAVDSDDWQLDLFGSYFIQGYNDHTFFRETGDVRPQDDALKGMERKNTVEAGLELTRKSDWGRFGLQLRHDARDVHGGAELRGRWARVFRGGHWQLEPWAEYTWISSDKADYYFGVRTDEVSDTRPAFTVDDGSSLGVGLAGRYTAWNQHQLNLNLSYRQYGGDIVNSPIVSNDGGVTLQMGYRYELGGDRSPRYTRDNGSARSASGEFNFITNNANPTSMRVAYGCTTEVKFVEILQADISCWDPGTQLASVFGARRITESMFNLPIEGWAQLGLAKRFEDGIQEDFWEGVFAFKMLYRNFPWSKRFETRVGFSNGMSYAGRVPFIEIEKAERKGRRESHLLHYLEFSLDVSVGDVTGLGSLKKLFAGFYVHHRSGIFGSSNFYNNVDGGSNANMLYLEWEFD